MTTTKAQLQALFSQPAAWELTLIRRPRDLVQATVTFIEHPELCELANVSIKQLSLERKKPPAKPTKCLLCEADFLTAQPAMIVLMRPATREGPGVSFLLCDGCAARPIHECEQNIRAGLHKHLGAQEVEWGTA